MCPQERSHKHRCVTNYNMSRLDFLRWLFVEILHENFN